MRVTLGTAVLAVLLAVLPVTEAAAQSTQFRNNLQEARKREARGDMASAGSMYFSLLKTNCYDRGGPDYNLPAETKILLGRRAAACLTIAARKEIPAQTDLLACTSFNLLHQTYDIMAKLDASSPTWPYLQALRYCAFGNYVEARDSLNRCLKTSGGQESVRQKARYLLSHIQPYADNDLAQLRRQDAEALGLLLSGKAAADWAAAGEIRPSEPSPSMSSSSSVPDYERRARDAESRGDYGAAERFRSGGTTVQDSSKYW